MNLDIVTAPRASSTRWSSAVVVWDDWVAALATPAAVKECGGYVFGTLAGARRNRESVVSRSAVGLDLDHLAADTDVLARLSALGYRMAWHTTWRHTSAAPRYRVVLPLARPVTPDEYAATVDELVRRAGLDGELDERSRLPEQFMWGPSAQAAEDYRWGAEDGALLEPGAVPDLGITGRHDFDLDELLVAGAPDGAHDDTLKDVAWFLRLQGFTEPDARDVWDRVVDATAVDPARPFGDADWARHWGGADAKISEQEGQRGVALARAGAHPIWDATPVLKRIQRAAHSRMVGSGALLAYTLGRVLAEVPTSFVLPATVGSTASLNLGFAIVGESGTGKTSAGRVSADLLGAGMDQNYLETGVGSGEGLIEAFLEPDPNAVRAGSKQLVSPPSRILMIDEIGRLGAVARRDGSSMMSVLRSGLTGDALKTSNATVDRVRSVPPGVYRLVVFAGVQPELSDVLLHESNAGTPQRFVWVSSTDPTIPEEPPTWPGELDWSPAAYELMGALEVDYPQHIKDEIRRERWLAARGEDGVDPLHGHRVLTQLKVAAALALLHYETKISDQWWAISAHIMRWSDQEQRRCLKVLGRAAERKVAARVAEAVVQRQKLDEELITRAKKRVLVLVGRGLNAWWAVREGMSSAQRDVLEDAVEELVKERKVVVKEVEYQGQVGRSIVSPGG